MQASTLKLETEVKDGVLMVQVSGPLDSATYDHFKDFMAPIVAQPHARVVLDCRKLTYVNSHAWTLLMHYRRVALQERSDFKVAAIDPRSLKGLHRMGLDKCLAWLPTVEAALHPALAM
ncbi:MAG: STAS domain-containing protein [Kiritimatiellia bacterium]